MYVTNDFNLPHVAYDCYKTDWAHGGLCWKSVFYHSQLWSSVQCRKLKQYPIGYIETSLYQWKLNDKLFPAMYNESSLYDRPCVWITVYSETFLWHAVSKKINFNTYIFTLILPSTPKNKTIHQVALIKLKNH